MILDCLYESFKNLENELRCSKNHRIKSFFCEFEQCVNKHHQDIIIEKIIASALSKIFVSGGMNQAYFEDIIIEQFDYLLSHIDEIQQTMILKVSLQNHSKELYRVMKLPYMMKLDDFCFHILAGFKAQECKEFSLEINQLNQCGYDLKIGDNDMEQLLSTYHIHKDTQMKLYYDYDKTYVFDIEVINIENHFIESGEFIEGRGYGIWENEIESLELYYQDKNQFDKYIKEIGLDIHDYFIDEFDFYWANSHLIEDIEILRMKYNMKYEERKLFNEYLPFSYL